MSITSAIVLYAVIWFMVFLIVIPIRLQTQGDVGRIVPGTHAGSARGAQSQEKGVDHHVCQHRFMDRDCRDHPVRLDHRARSGLLWPDGACP